MKKKKLKKQLKIWQKSYRDVLERSEKKDEDIRTLVFEPESIKAKEIIATKEMERDQINNFLFGSRNCLLNGNGLLNEINDPNKLIISARIKTDISTGIITINVAGMDPNQWVNIAEYLPLEKSIQQISQ